MRLKTYRAYSLQEAIEAVQGDLGSEAVILHTRSFSKRVLLGLLRRNIVEVIASDTSEISEQPEREGLLRHVLPSEVAASRAYSSTTESTEVEHAEESSSEVLDIDSTRTRRIAQALSIRQERLEKEEAVPQHVLNEAESEAVDTSAPRRYVLNDDGDLTAEIRQPVEVTQPEVKPQVATEPQDGELEAIRATVGRVIETDGLPSNSPTTGRSDTLADAYTNLISQELSRELADGLVDELSKELPPEMLENSNDVREAVLERLAALVPTSETTSTPQPIDGRPWTIAFVGPTGVGKTTTLAKVASTLALKQGR